MVDKTHHSKPASSGNEEAAFVDAYEARMAGGSASQVPAQWRDEIESMARLHERVSALPLPEVAPSVRAIVLGAAAQVAADRPVSVWARVSHWLLRPGPILAGATAAAVVFALAVRPDKPVAPLDGGAVALLENAPPAASSIEPVVAAAPQAPPELAAAADAPPAAAEDRGAAAAAPPAQEPVPAPAAVARAEARPAAKAIAAEPASVGPQGAADLAAVSAEAKRAEPAQWNAEAANAGQRQVRESAEEQVAKASRRPGLAPVMGAVGGQNAKPNQGSADDAPQKDQAAVNQQFAQAPPAKVAQAEALAQQVYAERAGKAEDNVKAPALDQAAQAKAAAVAKLRSEVDRTADPAKRVALLQQLLVMASQSGDAKAAVWAKEQLAVAQRANANNSNNASGASAPGKAKAAAESAPSSAAPAEKPAAEKVKSTSY